MGKETSSKDKLTVTLKGDMDVSVGLSKWLSKTKVERRENACRRLPWTGQGIYIRIRNLESS
jgi:hypothetical protein